MKKVLEFIIARPRIIIALLLLTTVVTAYGITLFEYDNSEKNAMPAGDPTFQLGEETKKMFGDSSTFFIAAIEPAQGKKLMTAETFRHLNGLVNEIHEYRIFNQEREDGRLKSLLDLSGVKVNGSVKRSKKEIETASKYDQPSRERNLYDYSSYRPVSPEKISAAMDETGKAMFDTILAYREMSGIDRAKPFAEDAFRNVLESWEDLYLYKSVQIMKEASDPITLTDINGENDTLRSVSILKKDKDGKRILPETPEDFVEITKKLRGNPSFESNFYSLDPKTGDIRALAVSMTLRSQLNYDRFTDYLWALFGKYNHDPVNIHLQGGLIFEKFINEYNNRDMMKYLPIGLIIMLVIYYLNFKSIRGMVLPITSIVMGSVWTMGLLGYMGIKMTVLTSIIPPLLIAIGSAYSIHIVNQYYIDLENIHALGKSRGLVSAMLHIVNTVLLTGLATFVSFLTLTTNDVRVLTEFGIGIALGTVIIIAISLTLLPAALSILKLPPVKVEGESAGTTYNDMVLKAVGFMSRLSTRHYGKVIVVVLITIAVSVAGILMLKTETSATSYFKEGSYIRTSLDRTNELFDGSYVTNIVFSPGPGKSILDAEFLAYIEEVQQWLRQPENREKYHILHNASFNEYLKRMNKAMNNEDPAYYTVPADTMTILDYLELFSGEDENYDGRPDLLEPTMSPDYTKTVLYMRMGTLRGELMSTSKIETTLNHVREYLDSKPNPKGYTYYITGGTINFVILAKYINQAQIQGIISGIISIGIIMFLLFRSPETGLVVLVPMVTSIVWIFGFMGWYGIPFGMTEALISPIAIGIGIDDACHILNTLRKKSLEGLPLATAITETHHETGLAIVYTSLANSLGAAVLIFSSFMPVFRSGLLVCAVLIISTLSNLVLFPSVIMFFRIDVCKIREWRLFKLIPINKLLID